MQLLSNLEVNGEDEDIEAIPNGSSSSCCTVDNLSSLFQKKLCITGDSNAPYEPVSQEVGLKSFCRYIPYGLANDTPSGRKLSPILADLALLSAFSSCAMIFPPPLSITLSEDAGLVLKNTMRGIETIFLNKADKSAEDVKRDLLKLLNQALRNPEIAQSIEQLNTLLMGRVAQDDGIDEVVQALRALLMRIPTDSSLAQSLSAEIDKLNVLRAELAKLKENKEPKEGPKTDSKPTEKKKDKKEKKRVEQEELQESPKTGSEPIATPAGKEKKEKVSKEGKDEKKRLEKEKSEACAKVIATISRLLLQAQDNSEIPQEVHEEIKALNTLIINKAEIVPGEAVKELSKLLPQAQSNEILLTALREEIEALNKAQATIDRAKFAVKIAKYISFAAALAIGGGIDLYREMNKIPSLQLLAKAGGILAVSLDRDLVEYLRPVKVTDPANPTGPQLKVHKAMWIKLSFLAATAGSGTLCILGDINPILTNGLLNSANTAIKMIGKDNKSAAWNSYLGLGAVTALSIIANVSGLGLRQWVDLGTYLKYASPVLITSLKLCSTAGQRAILEKLIGDDGEDNDDDEENKKEPAPLPVRLGFLGVAIIASLGVLYYKFSQPNQLSCLIPNGATATPVPTNSSMPAATPAAGPQMDEMQMIFTYAIGLLMAVPLKIAGKIAKNVMDELPRARVITPVAGGLILVAEAISYPYQCQMPIISIVAFTCFAAIASKLIAGAIKDFMLGEKVKKKPPAQENITIKIDPNNNDQK